MFVRGKGQYHGNVIEKHPSIFIFLLEILSGEKCIWSLVFKFLFSSFAYHLSKKKEYIVDIHFDR